MSDLLHTNHEDLNWPEGRWTPNDQVRTALDPFGQVLNPAVVTLALGLGLTPESGPAFIPCSWLGAATLLVPTAGGVPIRVGRMRVMPVFSDAEALEAWLPEGAGQDHPCFGPPADGVGALRLPADLGAARAEAGAVMICLNPAGPGGYQLDPEDGALDRPLAASPEGDAGDPSPAVIPAPGVSAPPAVRALVKPAGRRTTRLRIRELLGRAQDHTRSGRCAEAVRTLAAADRLGEGLGDYLHRSEMMVMAAQALERAGHREAAGRLAHYAVLAAGLSARGRLEFEAIRLRDRLI